MIRTKDFKTKIEPAANNRYDRISSFVGDGDISFTVIAHMRNEREKHIYNK